MAIELTRHMLRIEDMQDPSIPEKLIELIEGELIEMTPPTPRHNRVAFKFQLLFNRHCEEHPEFDCGGQNDGFVVQRNPDSYLQPDASLFRVRPDSDIWPRNFGPEIAVEVLSPSNSASEMAFKRHRFFAAGTEQFWLVDAERRQIEIYFGEGRLITASGDTIIVGEGIVAGMRIDLREIFKER